MYMRKPIGLIFWKILALLVLLVVLIFSISWTRNDIRNIAYGLGYNAYEDQEINIVPSVLNIVNSLWSQGEFSTLRLDINQKNINVLQEKAKMALRNGTLQRSEGDKIKAVLTVNGESQKVTLRLKGDQLDHLRSKKVSLRVEAKDPIFGLRRFNLQHPKIRGFIGPFLLDNIRKNLGIAAPRHFFVRLVANGRDYGIMHMEEHFSKELLESNQKKDTQIIKFDEGYYWKYGKIFEYKNSPLTYFSRSKKEQEPHNRRFYDYIVAQYELFLLGDLSAHELFDCESWGEKIALDQFFGTVHGLRWSNLRFYANPYSLKLEPIGFDDAFNERLQKGLSIFDHDLPFISMLYQDPKMLKCLNSSIYKLSESFFDPQVSDAISRSELLVKKLQKEFYFLKYYNTQDLRERVSRITDMTDLKPSVNFRENLDGEIARSIIPGSDYVDIKLLAKVLIKRNQHKLIIPNAHLIGIRDVEILNEGAKRNFSITESDADLILELGDLAAEDVGKLSVKLTFRDQIYQVQLDEIRKILIPSDASETITSKLFNINHKDKIVSVNEGEYVIDKVVELPRGYSVTQDENIDTVIFAKDKAGLVFHGGVDFRGMLKITGTEGGAGWILLNAEGNDVNIRNIAFENTTYPSDRVYPLTGSFTLYASRSVKIDKISFLNVLCEDALNIVESDFNVLRGTFSHTYSDAIDVDFGTGVFNELTMYDIGYAGGGDAVDVSGSTVTVTNSKFEMVSDKAISAGENSNLTLKSSKITNALVGVAAKDGSHVSAYLNDLRDSGLRDFMAYNKKPEYSSPSIEIFSNDKRQFSVTAATGSSVYYNGQQIAAEEVDVDQLYDTVMKSSRK